jgi:hypothetical protein
MYEVVSLEDLDKSFYHLMKSRGTARAIDHDWTEFLETFFFLFSSSSSPSDNTLSLSPSL